MVQYKVIGRTISHYEILEKLGQGGMGVVYKAHDTQLGRTVALKFLSPHSPSLDQEKARFLHEAKAAAALQHPNICTVHEIGQENDQTFIAMAFLAGRTLQERIAAGPLAPAEAVDIAIQVGQGLQEAHGQEVMHRDIKPANIMITERGQAVVMDFGLAKMTATTRLTRTGTTMGTAGYMSPEQVRGEGVDFRSDIWSVGVVLHEMLTGFPPFSGDNEAALMYALINKDPDLPTNLRSDIPPGLDAIVAKALTKDPDRRYQEISEMVADLQDLRADPEAFPAGKPPRRRLTRGQRVTVIVGAAALMTMLIVVGWRFWPGRVVDGQNIGSLAILPLENLSGQEDQEVYADGLTMELISTLGRVGTGSFTVIGRRTVMGYKGSDLPLAKIAEELNVDAVIEGSVQLAGNRIHITAELIHAATERILWTDVFDGELGNILSLQRDVALAVARATGADLSGDLGFKQEDIHPVDPAAYRAYLQGKLKGVGGRKFFQQAVELDSTFAAGWAHLSNALTWAASFDLTPTEKAFPQARAAALKALELNPNLAFSHTALGEVYLYQDWDWPAAQQEFQRALELDPASGEVQNLIAYNLLHAGRFEECLTMSRKAVLLDPLNEYNQLCLGYYLVFTRHFDEALRHFEDLQELFPDSRFSYAFRMEMGWAYGGKGKYEEAVAIYQQLGDSTYCYWSPGSHWSVSQEFARSSQRQTMLDAIVVAENKYRESPTGLWAWVNAYGHAALDQHPQAMEWLARSGIEFQKFVEEGHPEAKSWVFRQARVYAWLGEKDLAFQWLEKAYVLRSPKMIMMNHIFEFDSIREDPRFPGILERIWGRAE